VVTVNKLLGEDIIQIAEKVRKYVDQLDNENKAVRAIILDDATTSLSERLDMLIGNGILGVILVLLSLTLFLDFRLAFWVAIGLPFSFLGAFLLMYLSGITMNVISLFGFIVVIGILVDDAIVVSEQIYQNYEQGRRPFTAALRGTWEVLPSVVFAVVTTMVAFAPFFFLDGSQGRNMVDMAFVVIVILGFSLIEAALILPSHLAHSRAISRESKKGKFRERLDKILAYPRDVWLAKSLDYFMDRKFIIIAIAIALTFVTIGAYRGGVIGATFFPSLENDSFEISLELPAGTREHITRSLLKRIEGNTWDVADELEEKYGKELIRHVIIKLGQGPTGLFGAVEEGGSNIGTIKVVMISGEERETETFKVANMVREKTGPIYEAEKVIYGSGSRFGKPISISMLSNNLDNLQAAKIELKSKLNSMPELKDVEDNDPEGLREIKIKLNQKARLLGMTNLQLAMVIRRGYFGAEAQRLQRGEDEVKVWVRYSDEDRSSIGNLENLRVRLPQGREYPLKELITYTTERGTSVINHVNGKRNIKVEAGLVDENAEVPPILNRVMDEILPPILNKYPDISLAESGQKREIFKTARSARVAMPIAFLIMFFLVTLSFRSFSQSVVVFALLPLGFIGASWGHFFYGMPINMMSAYGILALMGVIINDAIVYINTMNQFLRDGMPFRKAVFETSINRFRPIFLTTVTTVLGLLPLLAETSRQARFLIPMAISVSAGLLFGSMLTIMFLPIFLIYMNKIRILAIWLWNGEKPSPEDVEPAVVEQRKLEKYTDENNQ
jgi:multidrug efflux pump subunit AcrB